jgi:phage protein D/phage baseplate assembly protein gpV
MPDADRSTRPTIEVDGRELDASVMPDVERTVVDDHLHLPDTFELTVRDHARDVLERTNIRIGSRVKISAPALGSSTAEALITGEVTSVEGSYTASGSKVIVRGYDHAHRLARGRRTETYRNVKCSDVARTVAGRAGLETGTIDDSGEVLDYVAQGNQTDLDFLRGLARPIGFEVAVLDGKLDFRRPAQASEGPGSGDYASTDPAQLVFGQDLLEFRPRVTSAGQVGEVQVRGWSVAEKAALVGTAPGGTTAVQLPDTPADLASRFGNPTHVVVDRAFATQRAVDDAARAAAESIGSTVAEAIAKARGNPALKAGRAVNVSMVAAPFAGRYTLTHTRHVFDDEAGYVTELVVSGRQERSLLGLASTGTLGGSAAQFAGVVIGIVTDSADPDKLGRVKLRFPWLADEFETDWARVVMLGAGPDRGAVFVPEVNDEVLVAFEHGEFRSPFVVGGLWNGQDKPPDHDTSGGLQERSIVSRLGNKIVLIDKDGSAGIRLVTASGKCEVFLDDGSNEVVIKSGGGKVTIDAQSDVVLKSTGNFTIESSGNVDIKASGNANLQASGMATVKGAQVQLG